MKRSPMPARRKPRKGPNKRYAPGSRQKVPPGRVERVLVRAGGCCERCGVALAGERGFDWSIHHRKNRSAGGRNNVANLLALCGDGTSGCHGWVTENPLLAGDEGTHVPSWRDPVEVPLLTLGRFVLLSDDGAVRAA